MQELLANYQSNSEIIKTFLTEATEAYILAMSAGLAKHLLQPSSNSTLGSFGEPSEWTDDKESEGLFGFFFPIYLSSLLCYFIIHKSSPLELEHTATAVPDAVPPKGRGHASQKGTVLVKIIYPVFAYYYFSHKLLQNQANPALNRRRQAKSKRVQVSRKE